MMKRIEFVTISFNKIKNKKKIITNKQKKNQNKKLRILTHSCKL